MGAGETGGVFFAGAVAGIFEGVSVQPMEMVKTRFQINKGEKMRIIPTMRAIVAEGGVRQLYRGGLPEIAGLVPRSSAMWSGYEMGRRKLIQLNGGVCTTPIVAAAGACGGICEGVAFQPFQIVKVRLMAKEHLGRYKNTFDCVAKIVRSEGVAALSIGLGPTLWRNCVWDSVYLSGVYNLDKVVPKPENVALQLMHNMVQGTLMGMFATCFNAPFDVCKSRFQAQLPGDPNPYSSTFGALCRIAAEEGLQGLYKGFAPKAIRLGVGQTIGLTVFQALLPKEHGAESA